MQILSKINEIKKITNNRFSVKIADHGVCHTSWKRLQDADVWTCECRDFMARTREAPRQAVQAHPGMPEASRFDTDGTRD